MYNGDVIVVLAGGVNLSKGPRVSALRNSQSECCVTFVQGKVFRKEEFTLSGSLLKRQAAISLCWVFFFEREKN